jgi:hypothetical protein
MEIIRSLVKIRKPTEPLTTFPDVSYCGRIHYGEYELREKHEGRVPTVDGYFKELEIIDKNVRNS